MNGLELVARKLMHSKKEAQVILKSIEATLHGASSMPDNELSYRVGLWLKE